MTIFGISISMAIIWLVLAVIFLAIEAATVGLTTIWFAAGSFVGLLLSLFHVPVLIQVIVFLVISFCLLLFTRKIFVEKLKTGTEATNVDAIIGMQGKVTASIQPLSPGQVRIGGQEWTAVAENDNEKIEKDITVKVVAIEGVKLIVVPAEEK